ncbi:MAG: ASCH domain-containing protein [Phycisphaerales bacterium]|nr:ASCH domain-containing protein [Phycisphaerales bacterium]
MHTGGGKAASRHLLVSVHPEFSRLILAGRKSVELRRVRPSVCPGDVVLFYETAPRSAIVAWAKVVRVHAAAPRRLWSVVRRECGTTRERFLSYFERAEMAYAIRFGRVRRRTEPLPLEALRRTEPAFWLPQSYRYLDSTRSKDQALLALVWREGAFRRNENGRGNPAAVPRWK